jgi:hypothetical protein
MANNNEIETIIVGKHKLYNLNKYLRENKIPINSNKKNNICYCRVSSMK